MVCLPSLIYTRGTPPTDSSSAVGVSNSEGSFCIQVLLINYTIYIILQRDFTTQCVVQNGFVFSSDDDENVIQKAPLKTEEDFQRDDEKRMRINISSLSAERRRVASAARMASRPNVPPPRQCVVSDDDEIFQRLDFCDDFI